MSLVSCFRIRFKIATDLVSDLLPLIEECTAPDAVATGEIAEGKEPTKGLEAIELLYQQMPDEAILQNIFAQLSCVPENYMVDSIGSDDWVTASLRELPAVTAGRFIIYGDHARPLHKTAQIPLEIEAGLAFGTGHHETTEGCLHALSYLSKFFKPQNIADIGTGTGVLAMAAWHLWHKPILATDIDPIAIRVTDFNLRKNKLSPYIQTKTCAGVGDIVLQKKAPYDLMIANILARPLIALAHDFGKITADNGYVVLSGLLWRQVRIVYQAYQKQGFILHKALNFGEWGCLILHKPVQ